MDDLRYKFYQSDDEHKILTLFELVYGKEISLEWWRWRFLENPIDKPKIALCFNGSNLVGHYAVSPFEFYNDGTLQKAALSMATMTHPDYESRGLFTTLANMLYDDLRGSDYHYIFGFPNKDSHGVFVNKLKWQDIGLIHTLTHNSPTLNTACRNPKIDTLSVSRVSEFLESIPTLARSGINFSSRFINWRVAKKSGNVYFMVRDPSIST
ncbi:GNAT family N-acetyltransferase, partial [Planktomarina sp.]|nr:GNAT family N-acetyltransferase [Planktomarina sp.]